MYKLGSLFDGSGGFPLAGSLCGITPVWASEVEPYPIAVTRERFPNMKHLGSVTDINGAKVQPVDVITFGSPCQDLSIAGKRAGLKHETNGDEETTRSGLFMEAVRIIKEMRAATGGKYPRYALWENVPGAFSSNKGEDFRVVLEELIKIVEPSASMPPVPKKGWSYFDRYCGDGWSLAYRTLDSQGWGVPQRRRRIYLVLDLGDQCAEKILFEREGLRGYFAEGRAPWESTTGNAQTGTGADDSEGAVPYTLKIRSGCEGGGKGALIQTDMSATLSTVGGDDLPVVYYKEQHLFENHSQDTRYKGPLDVCPMLPAQLGTGGNNQPFVAEEAIPINDKATRYKGGGETRNGDGSGNGLGIGQPGDPAPTLTASDRHAVLCMATQQGGAEIMEDMCPTITAAAGMSGNNQPILCMATGQANAEILENQSPTLNCNHEQPIVFDKEVYNSGVGATGGHYISQGGPAPTLRASVPPGVCVRYIVRRITPTECARLQGFPDEWGHVTAKEHFSDDEYTFWLEVRNTHAAINEKAVKDYNEKQMLTWYNKLWTDSAEYKMWGNGIALPTALYVMQGIQDALEETNGQ